MPISYRPADDLEAMVREVVKKAGMSYIDPDRVLCFRSQGSRSKRVIARCYSLPKIWQMGLNTPAHYIIEVISERFDKLSYEEKVKVVIHELLHIPKTFGGGLRPHRGYVTNRAINEIYGRLISQK
ncbi:MAG: putative metallopeptidase [Candidatus Methanosuratincola verstraetei]|jgi:predicted metallopeptidase|uniref:Metallopeptidase n=2 Tax=Candidatus Methanosuratincola (ex Vanwonterghem et al. 2016) TaxID=1915412 RepID=A0A3S3VBT6_METS7|nr:MAG: metallopeptidase [Candidatus Methanosuratincola subterraneus]